MKRRYLRNLRDYGFVSFEMFIDTVFSNAPEVKRVKPPPCSGVLECESRKEAQRLETEISEVFGGELGLSNAQRVSAAQERHGFSCDQTWMFGDAISNVRQGKIAGVKTGAIAWGFQDRQLLEAEAPDCILVSPEELLRKTIHSSS